MTVLWQTVAGALVTVILCAVLKQQGGYLAVLLGLAACSVLLMAAFAYLEPVMEFVQKLKETAGIDDDLFSVVVKAVGVGLITEFAGLICADSGNGAVGKAVETVGAAVILWLSLPLMTGLLELVQQMVGNL